MIKYKHWAWIGYVLLLCAAMLCMSSAFAAVGVEPPPPPPPTNDIPTASDMLINIAKQVPNLMRLVTAFAYVMGMYLIFVGLIKLKQYGEARTQMSGEKHLAAPMAAIIVGTLLLYFPTTVQQGLSTFWTNPNPYDYMDQIQSGQWLQFIDACFSIVQLFGTIAFIKGLIMLSQLGGGGHQQGHVSKAIVHIIAGIMCINISQFVQLVAATLGIQSIY